MTILAVLMLGASSAATAEGTDWGRIARSVLGTYGQAAPGVRTALSDAQVVAGLKEALSIGSGNVVARLGKAGGFNLDPKIHIPLPLQLQKVDAALRIVGRNGLTRDLEAQMNAAAELATPKAKQLFIGAISQMTFADARAILFSGQQDAATQFFRRTMGAQLVADIKPIVASSLADAGAIKAFDAATASYSRLPLAARLTGDAKANLNSYVASKAVDGIFYYVAQEEAAIRQNPAKRTTALLKTVFGAK